jgi:beta-galactosidase
MEQQSGSGGWEIVSTAPRPGEIRLWAYQAIAHGADGIVFFRWRTARHGTEQYWHGILDHHAQPGRRYAEVKCMGEEIRRVGTQILNSQPAADVAILHSYDTRFAFQIQANNPHFRYEEHILNIFRAFHGKGIPADVIAADADLSAYKLVVLPAMYVLTEEVAENVTRFVENGGTLIVTARTGVKDQYNVVVERYLPGLLSDLCGVTVAEYDSIPADRAIPLELNGDTNVNGASARLWCDVLTPTTAATVATYTQDYYAGQPAITHNRVGRGHVVTIGTFGDAALYAALLPWFSTLAGVAPLMDVPDGVEVTQRVNGEKRITFVLNHTTEPKTVIVPPASSVLLSSQPDSGGAVTIPARDLIIFTVE